MGVPGVDEAMEQVAQVLGGPDTGAAQALATHDRKPNLDLVEPRAMGGQPMKSDRGTLGRTPVQHRLFLMIAGIVHNQMPATVGVADAEGVQEVAKLQIGMALIALREDFPRTDIKGGKEIDDPMAEILKLLALHQAGAHGQRRVQALQGLNADTGQESRPSSPQTTGQCGSRSSANDEV